MKIYVNNSEVGEYSVFRTEWEINLKQKILLENGSDIIQITYHNPSLSDFFAIYGYIDECGKIDFYIIDSRKMPERAKEYHAIKTEEEINKLAIKLMLEDW
jgi:hypothetical protein